MKNIKLVLSGSGTLYPVHCGAIAKLHELDCNITEICGTSGGAIVAAAIASGYTKKEELQRLVKVTLPSKNNLIDFSLFSLLTKWGLIGGDKIEKTFNTFMMSSFGKTKIPLHIVTTNLNRKAVRVFSTHTDPNMNIAKAIRASMSIPGVFTPVMIDGEMYVDGGVTANYMLDIFGTGEDVIGLRFGPSSTMQANWLETKPTPINGVFGFMEANINSFIEACSREHMDDAVFAKTIMLNSRYNGLNFKCTDADVDAMFKEGYDAVSKWAECKQVKSEI